MRARAVASRRGLPEAGLFPGIFKLGEERRTAAVAHKRKPADPAAGLRDQAFAEGAAVKPVGDGEPLAAGLELAGGHRLAGHKEVVQPSGARKSGIEGGIQDIGGGGEQPLHILFGQKLQKALGADADPAAEQALEVKLAQADVAGDFLQLGLAVEVGFDEFDGLFDAVIVAARLGEVIWFHGGFPSRKHRVKVLPFW